ncbi:MAG: 3-hydroxyisobutyrate dehydrogenase-like beta-hydroxyacid dehydrogenase [Candidatus Latescibacterota bacterium]|jgi:3-hydroxyisobutyrate dehydrogenase-like beta-hydroxyacid dehydrogenase
MSDKQIGLIGLGLVGTALVERFIPAGFEVFGYDIDQSKLDAQQGDGFVACKSPAEVAEKTRRIVLSLPNSTIVNEVVEGQKGVLEMAEPGAIIIDTTTADPDMSVTLARHVQKRSIRFLDATILGSSQQVREADVLVMVGGALPVYDLCRDIFQAFALRTFHLGPSGKGAEAKLIVNLVLGLNRLVLAEGLVLAQKSGVDLNVLLDVLKAGGAYSRVMDIKGDKMINSDFKPQARLSQHLKDVDLILDMGARTETPLPTTALHAQLLRTGVATGLGDEDNSVVIEVLRKMAGL